MASDPDSIPRGQYRTNQRTPISIGGSSGGDGIATKIWLDSDVYSSTPSLATTVVAEVRPVGTAFSGSATATATPRILKEALLPTQRRGANLIYDSQNQRFILFGGYDGTSRFNEVWELTADSPYARWHKLTPSGTPPAAKNLAAAVYVSGTTTGSVTKGYMVVWGGASPSDLNEMHALDISTPGSEAWSAVTQTNTPAVRSYLTHHMATKPTGAGTTDLYLFGGWGSSRTNDLLRCTFNVNTPTSVTWTTLKANGAPGSPAVRSGTCMLYDALNNRLVLTGGYNGTAYLNDVWQYDIAGNAFSSVTVGGSAPGLREMASVGFDAVNQRAIIMGGWQGSAANCRNDVIQLSLTAGSEAWTQIKSNDVNNQAVLAFAHGAAAVDTTRNSMVVATQLGYDGTNKYVYAFDLNNTAPTAPMYGLAIADYFRGRDAPGCAYNTVRSEFVLVNGYSAMDDDTTITRGEHVSDIWAYNRTTNTWRYATKGPFTMPHCEGGLTIYDTANDRIIYIGGLTGANQRTNDVWQFKADTHGMYLATKLTPSGTPPTQRWLMAGCYDATNQRVVLWGGQSASSIFNDTWALSLTAGSEAWTPLTPTGTAPTAAWQASYDYDSGAKRLYIHGGATNAASTTFTSQLFYLDISTTNGAWTNTGVTGGLAVRGSALAYDSTAQRLVCFGGYDGVSVNNTVRYTSTASFTSWTTQATSNTPIARRSCGYLTMGSIFVVTCGRPPTGTWFSDTQELNLTLAPASWSWTNTAPAIYQTLSVPVTGLTARASYHWQTWGITGATTGTSSSFGNNTEGATDFVVSSGTGGNIKAHLGTWQAKPARMWNGSSWVTKPAKVWNGSAWIQTNY